MVRMLWKIRTVSGALEIRNIFTSREWSEKGSLIPTHEFRNYLSRWAARDARLEWTILEIPNGYYYFMSPVFATLISPVWPLTYYCFEVNCVQLCLEVLMYGSSFVWNKSWLFFTVAIFNCLCCWDDDEGKSVAYVLCTAKEVNLI